MRLRLAYHVKEDYIFNVSLSSFELRILFRYNMFLYNTCHESGPLKGANVPARNLRHMRFSNSNSRKRVADRDKFNFTRVNNKAKYGGNI